MPQANRLNLPSASLKQQIANKLVWNNARSAGSADFFTIGYAGRKTEQMLLLLKQHGVRTLVDIRQNAISMYRPELSKNNLARMLQENGLFYAHVPQLGVPRDVRAKAVDRGSREVIWDWYDKNVVAFVLDLYSFLNGYEQPVAFMCTEIDPHECHRHRLSLALEQLGFNSFDL
jgi:uncharacterized protein (DUF488 family)